MASISSAKRDLSDTAIHEIQREVVCMNPRVAVLHNFLSDEECDHLIDLAKPHLTPSTVVVDGQNVESQGRSSSGTFLGMGDDAITSRISKRIAAATLIPEENGEQFYILSYTKGQHYDSHFDYFDFNNDATRYSANRMGGQRQATILMYLSDVEEGGETHFPHTQCAQEDGTVLNELKVPPKKGRAVFWYSTWPNGTVNPASLHAGMPVIRGHKWSATRWMRMNSVFKQVED